VFLDGGYDAVRATVRRTFGEALEALDPRQPAKDDKTRLQELLQARRQKLPNTASSRPPGRPQAGVRGRMRRGRARPARDRQRQLAPPRRTAGRGRLLKLLEA